MSDIYRRMFVEHLSGVGLDIGPLHRPMVKTNKMFPFYVDRMPVSELRKHYPELAEFDLVEPDYLDDAETLKTIPDNFYNFVIAAHVIEHMRNPIGAVDNWLRVLKPGGMLYLVVPDYRKIFDKDRERTTIDHLIEDWRDPSTDRDWMHYLEYSQKVDKEEGKHIVDHAYNLLRIDYSIHYHTFVPETVLTMLSVVHNECCHIEIVDQLAPEHDYEFHFLVKKMSA